MALARVDARAIQRSWLALIASLVALFLADNAFAQANAAVTDGFRLDAREQVPSDVPTADVNLTVYETDNARRTPTGGVDDTVVSPGFTIDTVHQGQNLTYLAAGDIDYLEYLHNTYQGQVYGSFDGEATVSAVPHHVDWLFRESVDKLLVDPTVTETLTNIQTYNYFTTGPRLSLQFGQRTDLSVEGTYSRLDSLNSPNLTAGIPDLDSTRTGANVALTRAFSDSSRSSLNLRTEKIDYSDATVREADYRDDEASISYNSRVARTTLAIEAGATRITQHGQGATGLLARAAMQRRMSSSQILKLSFMRQTADAADIVRYDFGLALAPGQTPLLLAAHDPLVDTTVSVGWQFEKPRTRIGIDVYRMQERYTISTNLNRALWGSDAYYERRLTPTVSLKVLAQYFRESYQGEPLDDHEIDTSVSLNWRPTRRLRITFRADRYDRSGQGATLTFTENRIGVRFGYDVLEGTQR
jgi:hypothetical protein